MPRSETAATPAAAPPRAGTQPCRAHAALGALRRPARRVTTRLQEWGVPTRASARTVCDRRDGHRRSGRVVCLLVLGGYLWVPWGLSASRCPSIALHLRADRPRRGLLVGGAGARTALPRSQPACPGAPGRLSPGSRDGARVGESDAVVGGGGGGRGRGEGRDPGGHPPDLVVGARDPGAVRPGLAGGPRLAPGPADLDRRRGPRGHCDRDWSCWGSCATRAMVGAGHGRAPRCSGGRRVVRLPGRDRAPLQQLPPPAGRAVAHRADGDRVRRGSPPERHPGDRRLSPHHGAERLRVGVREQQASGALRHRCLPPCPPTR